jgi:hypothetical protein
VVEEMIICDKCKKIIMDDLSKIFDEHEEILNNFLKENYGDYCLDCLKNIDKYLKTLEVTITPVEFKEYQELKEREKVAQREKEKTVPVVENVIKL